MFSRVAGLKKKRSDRERGIPGKSAPVKNDAPDPFKKGFESPLNVLPILLMTAPRSESPKGLPANLAKGCVLCYQGAKMVLFVTGRCHRSCWYCPLSEERKGKDMVFANEHPIEIPAQAVEMAERMSALGTGVTGGEPLLCLDRVDAIL